MVAISGNGWRLAPCLKALIDQADDLFPNRSTASDGSIGDAAHASRGTASDHNPADGWVCAVDVTDDKAHGCDADHLAQHLVASRDSRVKYVIWNRTIVKSYRDSKGVPAWQPQPYTGVNAHEKHTHISVHNTAEARTDRRSWWADEEDDVTNEDILKIAEAVTIAQQPQLDALRKRLDEVQRNLAAVPRRILGVEEMADTSEQHKADDLVGAWFKKQREE